VKRSRASPSNRGDSCAEDAVNPRDERSSLFSRDRRAIVTQRSRARSPAPTTPASGPSSATRNSACGRCPRAVRCCSNARPAGPRSSSPAADTPPPSTNRPGSSTAASCARPRPSQVPTTSKQRSAATSPSCAAWVTIGPVIISGSPPARRNRSAAIAGEASASSWASCTNARPLAYCSQHPSSPHPQRRPSVRDDIDVPDLARDSKPAAQQPPTQHDAAANPGADRENNHIVLATPSTEPRLGPRGGVGVVLDHYRQLAASLDP